MFRYQKFKECPAKRPLTVCIDIPGVNVTHREVKQNIYANDAVVKLFHLKQFGLDDEVYNQDRLCNQL